MWRCCVSHGFLRQGRRQTLTQIPGSAHSLWWHLRAIDGAFYTMYCLRSVSASPLNLLIFCLFISLYLLRCVKTRTVQCLKSLKMFNDEWAEPPWHHPPLKILWAIVRQKPVDGHSLIIKFSLNGTRFPQQESLRHIREVGVDMKSIKPPGTRLLRSLMSFSDQLE